MGTRNPRGQATIEILAVMIFVALLILGMESLIPKKNENSSSNIFDLKKQERLR